MRENFDFFKLFCSVNGLPNYFEIRVMLLKSKAPCCSVLLTTTNKICSCPPTKNPPVVRHHSVVSAFSAALRHQKEENLCYYLLPPPQFTMPNVITCQNFPFLPVCVTCLKTSLDCNILLSSRCKNI